MDEKHIVNLLENEVITKVFGHSSTMIDCLKFKTNLGNVYGPYGDEEVLLRKPCKPRSSRKIYLHSFRGASVETDDLRVIVHISCRWVHFEE